MGLLSSAGSLLSAEGFAQPALNIGLNVPDGQPSAATPCDVTRPRMARAIPGTALHGGRDCLNAVSSTSKPATTLSICLVALSDKIVAPLPRTDPQGLPGLHFLEGFGRRRGLVDGGR